MDFHKSVLESEVTQILDPKPGKIFIDCTLGHGGHTKNLINSGAEVWGIDQDKNSLQIATDRINSPLLHTVHDNYSNFEELIKNKIVSGVVFDLGLSLSQLKTFGGGFSFNDDLSLDMRLNQKAQSLTAEFIVNTYPYLELVKLLSYYSQENLSKPIAMGIIQERRRGPIKTGTRLASVITKVYEKFHVKSSIHPATKTFMALRIAVNQEYEHLKKALNSTLNLNSNCVVIFISFHSGEDRIIKNFIRSNSSQIVSQKPIKPTPTEISNNPLSRSAILRSYRIK